MDVQTLINFLGALGLGGLLGSLILKLIEGRMKKGEIVFASLHAKRAEIIAELYRKLLTVRQAYAESTIEEEVPGVIPSIAERLSTASEAAHDFEEFFTRHRIYFGKSLQQDVQEVCDALDDLSFDLAEIQGLKAREFEKAAEKLDKEIAPVAQNIEEQFQRMLGI